MMEGTTTLRIDLGIQAQQIASQLLVNNKNIEQHLVNGIQKAIDSITEKENFEDYIAEATKKALLSVINDSLHSFSIRKTIQESLNKKIGDAIDTYGDAMADKIIAQLNSNQNTNEI